MHSASGCSYVAASGIIEVYSFRHFFIMFKDGMSLWGRSRCFILKVMYFSFVISVSVVDHNQHTLRTILLPVDNKF